MDVFKRIIPGNGARRAVEQTASAARNTAQKAANLGRSGLRMFRNFRSTANANTLRFLLRETKNFPNLTNNMSYSILRAKANTYLVSKGKPALSTITGANSVIRRVANILSNNNKVARQLANEAAVEASKAASQAVVNPTPVNLNLARRAITSAQAANAAARTGNAGEAAVQLTNARTAATNAANQKNLPRPTV